MSEGPLYATLRSLPKGIDEHAPLPSEVGTTQKVLGLLKAKTRIWL